MARTRIALRIPPETIIQIDKLAAQRAMTRTEYMIQAATGQLHAVDYDTEQRLDAVEARMDKLEDLAYANA